MSGKKNKTKWLPCPQIGAWGAWSHSRDSLLIPILFAIGLFAISNFASAAPPDRFDLGSIGAMPPYLSIASYRQEATLHAGSFAKPASTEPGEAQTEAKIGIAVGDGGTILRTTDGGKSWNTIEKMVGLGDDLPEPPPTFGARPRPKRTIPIPFWHFYDLAWLSPVDVVVIGGAFEPVTGISRGVCLISEDAGENWKMGNAHEMPRLLRFVRNSDHEKHQPASRSIPGTIEAVGDPAEASGVNRFFSHNGGRTWVEDTVARPRNQPQLTKPTNDIDSQKTIANARSGNLVVGPYGLIKTRLAPHLLAFQQNRQADRWQSIRGENAHASVAFVLASGPTAPWSLIGREALQEHQRVAVVVDSASDFAATDRMMDAAKGLGVTSCENLAKSETSDRVNWLTRHQPAIVALDDSLLPATRASWMDAIEQSRRSIHQTKSQSRIIPQRVVLCRQVHVSNADSAIYSASDSTDASIWKRSSILRSDALMTDPACLAGDFVTDAFMMCDPGNLVPYAVEVTTLSDQSGAIRRDISLAAGVRLEPDQQRDHSEVYRAAHRRLQIATARASQTAQLRRQLLNQQHHHSSGGFLSQQSQRAIEQAINGVLSVTAAEDRTRLLWDGLMQVTQVDVSPSTGGSAPINYSQIQDVLLSELTRHARPASIRRWAAWAYQTRIASIERTHKLDSRSNVTQWSDQRHRETQSIGAIASNSPSHHAGLPFNAPEAIDATPLTARAVSPFQVARASYEGTFHSTVAPATILVPQTKNTVWQTTPRWNTQIDSRDPSQQSTVGGHPAKDEFRDSEQEQRVNWDYHPIIMAGRRITNSGFKSSTESKSSTGSSQPILNLNQRPILDGSLDDACWLDAQILDLNPVRLGHAQNEEFHFLSVEIQSHEPVIQNRIRVHVDCDGDFLTTLDFDLPRTGKRSLSVDASELDSIQWYASASKDFRTAEFAILKSDLPAPAQRFKCSLTREGHPASNSAMPQANDWLTLP